MTADPYRNSAGPADPGSWNRYAYTRGDPVNRIDPSGRGDCPASTPTSVTVCDTADPVDLDPVGILVLLRTGGSVSSNNWNSGNANLGTGKMPWSDCPSAPTHSAVGVNNAEVRKNVAVATIFNQTLNAYVDKGLLTSAEAYSYRVFYMYEQFATDQPQDYKNAPGIVKGTPQYQQLDAFGNFNYGAVGAAMGFSPTFLQFAAGTGSYTSMLQATFAQLKKYGWVLPSIIPPNWGTPLTGPPWGDSPSSQTLIGQGFLWAQGFLHGDCP
jgi:putative RNase toxin 44 of polymorphic toxin system